MLSHSLHQTAQAQAEELSRKLESRRGSCLLAQQGSGEAEPFLLAGFAGLRDHKPTTTTAGRDNPLLAEAGEGLVRLYSAWGKPVQADEWRKRLETTRSHPEN